MRRLAALAAFLLIAAACSNDGSVSEPGSTSTSTSTSTPASAPEPGHDEASDLLVPSPEPLRVAVANGEITQLEADLYTTFALFGGTEGIPAQFLVDAGDASPDPQWSHGAPTRVLEQWGGLSSEDQARLASIIPTFDRYGLGGSVQGLRSSKVRGPVYECVQAHPNVEVCRTFTVIDVPQLTENADYLSNAWAQAVADAYVKFAALLPNSPDVTLWLDDLPYSGGYIYGFVPDAFATEQHCDMFVDVLLEHNGDYSDYAVTGVEGVPDGVPQPPEGAATVAHELFHCFQGANSVSGADWLIEGTATWAEHHVAPGRQTEHRFAKGFVELFSLPFLGRAYDASFAYLYADLRGGGAASVISMMQAGDISALDSSFPGFWHQVSVAAWNQEPADVLIDSGDQIPGTPLVDVPVEIGPDTDGDFSVTLAPYSRTHRTFEFPDGASQEELVQFARLALDLSSVPAEVKISALAETTGGWQAPEPLTGGERVFCRIAVGPCNDAAPSSIHPYTRIVLIATNVGSSPQTFSVPWNTFNPHLHGTWRRTQGPISLIPGNDAPYWILNTTLSFDEPAFAMSEATGAYNKVDFEEGWSCSFGGSYTIGGDPTYGSSSFGNASGTVAITGPGSGERFTNDCIYTTQEGPNPGFQTEVSGIHVPVNAAGGPGPFDFAITDHDALVVTGFAVQYAYERVSQTP